MQKHNVVNRKKQGYFYTWGQGKTWWVLLALRGLAVPPSGHSCRTHSLSEGCSYGVSGTSERRFGSQHKQLTLREGEEKFRMDVAGDCGHESNRSKGDISLSLIALSKLLLEKLITELLTVWVDRWICIVKVVENGKVRILFLWILFLNVMLCIAFLVVAVGITCVYIYLYVCIYIHVYIYTPITCRYRYINVYIAEV